jgi:hypothetical protein
MINKDIEEINRMILSTTWSSSGTLRFKYYGEFDDIKKIYDKCKKELKYIGNSNLDGSPIFTYKYSNISIDDLLDFKKLNLHLRLIKLKKYSNKKLTDIENSLLTFFIFFMNCFKNYEIKGSTEWEIRYIQEY